MPLLKVSLSIMPGNDIYHREQMDQDQHEDANRHWYNQLYMSMLVDDERCLQYLGCKMHVGLVVVPSFQKYLSQGTQSQQQAMICP